MQSLTQLTAEQKLRFVAALEPVEDKFDLVLVDSGAGIGDNVLFFVGAAQEALLVVSPEPTSLVDAYATVKVLSQKAGVRHFNVIINPVVDELPAREIFQQADPVTSRFLDAPASATWATSRATRTCTGPSWRSARWSSRSRHSPASRAP